MKTVILILSLGLSTLAYGGQVYNVEVTQKGFEPSKIEVKAGEEVTLNVTRKVKITCAKKVTVPSENITKDLPLNEAVAVTFTPSKKGEIKFGCAMDQMLGGVILVN